jgi:hypothetical protein
MLGEISKQSSVCVMYLFIVPAFSSLSILSSLSSFFSDLTTLILSPYFLILLLMSLLSPLFFHRLLLLLLISLHSLLSLFSRRFDDAVANRGREFLELLELGPNSKNARKVGLSLGCGRRRIV